MQTIVPHDFPQKIPRTIPEPFRHPTPINPGACFEDNFSEKSIKVPITNKSTPKKPSDTITVPTNTVHNLSNTPTPDYVTFFAKLRAAAELNKIIGKAIAYALVLQEEHGSHYAEVEWQGRTRLPRERVPHAATTLQLSGGFDLDYLTDVIVQQLRRAGIERKAFEAGFAAGVEAGFDPHGEFRDVDGTAKLPEALATWIEQAKLPEAVAAWIEQGGRA